MKLRKIIGMMTAVAVTMASAVTISVPTAFAESKPVFGKIAAVDRDSNPVTDINNVPTNLWAIQIQFGCTLDPETANV
ncbi:MAG: hypothetical protein IJH94_03740, partial [Clostridia bacterium]|nr:hypothetical protein [Clostridia bacterium]